MNLAQLISSSRMIMEAAGNAAAVSGSDVPGIAGCNSVTGILMIVVYAAIFYFLLIRPQKKRRQEDEKLRASVEVGDEVVTIGGICGRIVSIKEDDIIVIETGADRTKLKMKNWAIQSNETARARQAEIAAANAGEKKPGFFANLFGKKDKDQQK